MTGLPPSWTPSRWPFLRLAFGLAQIGGAVTGCILFGRDGPTLVVVVIVMATGIITVISRTVFGQRKADVVEKPDPLDQFIDSRGQR